MTRIAVFGWTTFAGTIGAAIVALGPMMGAGAMAGAILAIIIAQAPIVGLIASLFANTCFQVLGSAHIVGLPLSMSKIFGALTFGGFVVQWALQGWRLVSTYQTRAVIPFLVVVAVSTIVLDPTGVAMRGLTQAIQILLLFFLVANIAGRSDRALQTALWAIVIALAVAGIISILERYLPALHLEDDDARLKMGAIGAVLDRESLSGVVIKRVTGGMGDANWFSYTMAAGLPLTLYLWLKHERVLLRGLIALAGALMVVGLVFSFTRTGFLGLGVAVIYLLVRGVLPIMPVIAAVLALFTVSLFYIPAGLTERFFSKEYLEQGSTPLRRELVLSAYEIWLDSPIFGHGYGQYGTQYVAELRESPLRERPYSIRSWSISLLEDVETGREDPMNLGAHNMQLEILVEYGLIGFIAYAWWIIAFWRDTAFAAKRGPPDYRILAICIQASLLALLACSLLAHMKFLKILWILAGFAAALAFLAARQDERRGETVP
jgi:hypothetical protein